MGQSVEFFKSFDGKVFYTQEECNVYEQTILKQIERTQQFKKEIRFYDLSDDNAYKLLHFLTPYLPNIRKECYKMHKFLLLNTFTLKQYRENIGLDYKLVVNREIDELSNNPIVYFLRCKIDTEIEIQYIFTADEINEMLSFTEKIILELKKEI